MNRKVVNTLDGEKYKSDVLKKSKNFRVSRSVEDPLRHIQYIPNFKDKAHPLDILKENFSAEELAVITEDLNYFIVDRAYLNAIGQVKSLSLAQKLEIEDANKEKIEAEKKKIAKAFKTEGLKVKNLDEKLNDYLAVGMSELLVKNKVKEEERKHKDEREKLMTIIEKINGDVYRESTRRNKVFMQKTHSVSVTKVPERLKRSDSHLFGMYIPVKIEDKSKAILNTMKRNRKSIETIERVKKKRFWSKQSGRKKRKD